MSPLPLTIPPLQASVKRNVWRRYSLHRKNSPSKTWIIKQPKSYAGDRYIDYPDFVAEKWKGQKGHITELTPDCITNRFPIVLKHAGLNHFRFHDLRHPYVKPMTKNYFLPSNSCNSSILSRKWHSTGERISSCFFRYFSYSPYAFSRACLCVTLPFVVKISLLVIFR